MESALIPFLPYLLTSLLLLILSLNWFIRKRVTHSKAELPPGPWTLPFIGSLHHLATAGLPHHALHNLAVAHGPVMLLRLGEIDFVVVSSREAAKEVMKTHDAIFANRPAMIAPSVLLYGCKSIAWSSGPYWRQMRRICATELFSTKLVKSFYSIRQAEINSLLKTFTLGSNKSPVNLSAMTAELSSNISIHAAFAGTYKNKQVFLETLGEALECFSGFGLSDLFPSIRLLRLITTRRLTKLRNKLDLVIEEVIQDHLIKQQQRMKGGDDQELEYDLVDVLLNLKERDDFEEPITMDHIKAVILDIFIAGTETSSTIITWAMAELIKHPQIMERVQTEIRHAASENNKLDENSLSYLKLVIKETLRMHPPVPLLAPRQCMKSCQILGYTIPSEARVVVNAWALDRNPEYWDDPEKFKPERFETSCIDFKGQNFEFLPFGAGRRMCPGLEFGMAMVQESLASLLLHFDWKLPEAMKPEDMDMTETFGIAAAKKEPLYLIPTLCVPLPEF
ncbi:hypothetical protein LUZ62_064545 [Rhynchospora pubera]|uniref:Cytochrome P450 n=1 Tax=Rhynchospora pubera TaxID=906938 RepID=A0AAV8EPT1_9POAL|nr:hypothetical protein LUZ62_064545 [Rhynchospora pubera]